MTRRALIVAFALSPLRADDAQQIWDLFTQLAAFPAAFRSRNAWL